MSTGVSAILTETFRRIFQCLPTKAEMLAYFLFWNSFYT